MAIYNDSDYIYSRIVWKTQSIYSHPNYQRKLNNEIKTSLLNLFIMILWIVILKIKTKITYENILFFGC
jgi:hypothetical protein